MPSWHRMLVELSSESTAMSATLRNACLAKVWKRIRSTIDCPIWMVKMATVAIRRSLQLTAKSADPKGSVHTVTCGQGHTVHAVLCQWQILLISLHVPHYRPGRVVSLRSVPILHPRRLMSSATINCDQQGQLLSTARAEPQPQTARAHSRFADWEGR